MTEDLLSRLERFYDAVPRDRAAVERHGTFELFLNQGTPYPFYARPVLGGPPPTAADLAAVRARQRELGQPESFEWVDQTTPGLLPIAEAAGLSVLRAPLLVLDPARLADPGDTARIVAAAAPDAAALLAAVAAVAQVGFGAPGTTTGDGGPAERDAALKLPDESALARQLDDIRSGVRAYAYAELPGQGIVASGISQRAGDVAEIAGVATLPAARRRGLAGAVTALLARQALEHGVRTVFLSAASDDVARVYERQGFDRVATACIAEPAA
ncbi:GNAT family N-acetyltransferase [Catellatospora bangladeshensis]|uniref:GNAT family N-acetyltransferase n=1 Tax=Catellatospora bangladeshensis TaxID=310355 RepID=UPI001EF32BC3|nr:GNAT family N-acetyltransferase [Catellatospora bangladeshensis]